jgi:hypothetical protein
MQENNVWAQQTANLRQAQLQGARKAPPTPEEGRAALNALHQKGQSGPTLQGKAPEAAKAAEIGLVQGRAGLNAVLYKAMAAVTKPANPSPSKGRGR